MSSLIGIGDLRHSGRENKTTHRSPTNCVFVPVYAKIPCAAWQCWFPIHLVNLEYVEIHLMVENWIHSLPHFEGNASLKELN